MSMLVKFYQSHPENTENTENPDSNKLELKCVTSVINLVFYSENSKIQSILIQTNVVYSINP